MLQSNEIVAEGSMNSSNSRTNNKEESKRSFGCVISLSLTKVNSHFKIDPSTDDWVSYGHRVNTVLLLVILMVLKRIVLKRKVNY